MLGTIEKSLTKRTTTSQNVFLRPQVFRIGSQYGKIIDNKRYKISVLDPDQKGFKSFCQIRIRKF